MQIMKIKIFFLSLICVFSCNHKSNSMSSDKKDSVALSNKDTSYKSYKRSITNALRTKETLKQTHVQVEDTIYFLKSLKKMQLELFLISNYNSGVDTILFKKGNAVLHKLNLPSREDYNGYGFNGIKETDHGFELSIELGKYYVNRLYDFIYEDGEFYFSSIKTSSVDYHNNNAELSSYYKLKKRIPLKIFDINDFMYKITNDELKSF